MLVLTRKQLESIRIGDDIRITVTEVSGGRVKLAIEAPRHIKIDREEVHGRAARRLVAKSPTLSDSREMAMAAM